MAQCATPYRLRNPKYGKSSNPHEPPFIDAPCGRCYACLTRRRQVWMWRLQQERRSSSSCYFVTLTYDDENLPVDESTGEIHLSKPDVQKWLKRMRKYYPKKSGYNIRYYLVGEYGEETFRPHYHVILFNLPLDLQPAHDFIQQSWGLGHVQVGPLSDGGVGYVTKYILKSVYELPRDSELRKAYKEINQYLPFMLCSRKPLIGYRYVEKFKKWHLDDPRRTTAIATGGYRVPLPQSFINHIFEDAEDKKQLFTSFRARFADASSRVQRERSEYLLQQEQIGVRVDWLDEFPDPVEIDSRRYEQSRKKLLQNKSKRRL